MKNVYLKISLKTEKARRKVRQAFCSLIYLLTSKKTWLFPLRLCEL
jgi:hypothetical protein